MPSLLKSLMGKVVLWSGGASLAQQYTTRVLATSPLRYNKLNEGTGTTIVDSSGNAYTGTYTGIAWDGTLSPFNEPVPFYDGTNDSGNIHSAAFGTAFNPDEFTVMIWYKPFDTSVWTDGATRRLFSLQRDGSNFIDIRDSNAANNRLLFFRITSGASTKSVTLDGQNDANWGCVAISGSLAGGGLLSAGDLRAYKNGVQVGSTQTGMLTMPGSGLQSTATQIGAGTTTPTLVWYGYLAQFIVWNSPMSAAKLALMTA